MARLTSRPKIDAKAELPDRVFVTLAFGPPARAGRGAAAHHAVYWNKAAEMMRPFGWQEVERVFLGGGRGSYMTFAAVGTTAPKIPEPVQDWLKESQPECWEIGASIAKAAAGFLGAIAAMFGVPVLADLGRAVDQALEAFSEGG